MTDDFKDLTGLALLRHPRVVAVAEAMGVPLHWSIKCTDAIRTVDAPVEKVAFAMRDACVKHGCSLSGRKWQKFFSSVWEQFPKYTSFHDYVVDYAPPEHWIKAAVLAWEARDESL